MFCCRHFYRFRIEPHCKHRSIEFLTTQTDQSKGDILIDYVLKVIFILFKDGLFAKIEYSFYAAGKMEYVLWTPDVNV